MPLLMFKEKMILNSLIKQFKAETKINEKFQFEVYYGLLSFFVVDKQCKFTFLWLFIKTKRHDIPWVALSEQSS